jgi:hypothetical protein
MDFKVYYNENKASILATVKQEYVDKFIEQSKLSDDNKTIDMVFVIDKSGSMEDNLSADGTSSYGKYNSKSKSSTVLSALSQSVDYLKILSKNNHKIRLSVISFDNNSNVLLDKLLVDDTPLFNTAFNSIKHYLHPDGGTDIFKALKFTVAHVESILQTNSIDNVNIFVMTDGYHNNKQENSGMVEYFKSIPYRNKFMGMGIGNATEYDAELLDRLFTKLKGSPSAVELSDNISSDTFGACSNVISDFKITFEDFGSSQLYTPVNTTKTEDSISVSLDRIDFSQKLIFSFDNKDGFTTPLKMKVSYKNSLDNSEETTEKVLSEGEKNDEINDKINKLCHYVHDFMLISKSTFTQKENKEKTNALIDEFASWKKEERTGDVGELWTANEMIVLNHKKELEKYVDLVSYTAYTRVCSKQADSTISVGLTPSLSRQASSTVHAKYSNHQHAQNSVQIPEEIDFDEGVIGPAISPKLQHPWNSPDLKLVRQNACTVDLNELGPSSSGNLSTVPEEGTYASTISSLGKNLNTVWGNITPPDILPPVNLRSATSNPYGKEEDSNDYKQGSLDI